MKQFPLVSKIITIAIIIFISLYLLPLYKGIASWSFFNIIFENKDDFNIVLLRSFCFAILSSLLNVLFGLIGSIVLSKIGIYSRLGKYLGILIVPTILGNISISFIFKLLFFNTSFFDIVINSGAKKIFALLLLIQLWQYGTLFLYLFWLNIHNIPKSMLDYTKAVKLRSWEEIKDIILPTQRNLIILLLLLGFTFSFYENAKIQFVFKASQGTHTELINQWLYRTFQSNLLINPFFAIKNIFNLGMLILLISLIIFSIFSYSSNYIIKRISRSHKALGTFINFFEDKIIFYNINRYIIAIFLILLVILPISIIFFKAKIRLNKELIGLLFPFFLTQFGAICASSFAIIFGIVLRIGWKKQLRDFNNKSTVFLILLFLLQLIPPICILISGFDWMRVVGYSNNFNLYIIWIIGHTILSLPVLGSFVLFVHFRVKNNELDYLCSYLVKPNELIKWSFVKRFKAEYLLTIIISFSFIWNEAILNRVLSDRIPSFISNLETLIKSRGADYSKAFAYLMVSILISLSSFFIWKYITDKAQKTALMNKLNELS